jgi:hypothetical protein
MPKSKLLPEGVEPTASCRLYTDTPTRSAGAFAPSRITC